MISAWVNELLQLSNEAWGRLAFQSEPLVNRIPLEKRREYCENTTLDAMKLAQEIRQKYGEITVRQIVEQLNIKLVEKYAQDGGGFSMFASFEEPNIVTIFKDNADATDELIDNNELRGALGEVRTEDLLISHELYHYLELSRSNVYSAQQQMKVWQIGPFKNVSRIKCLGEIGAMRFARQLLGLNYSPNIFNVLMLYAQNPVAAERLYVRTLEVNNR